MQDELKAEPHEFTAFGHYVIHNPTGFRIERPYPESTNTIARDGIEGRYILANITQVAQTLLSKAVLNSAMDSSRY